MSVSRLRHHITSNTPCRTTDTASTAYNRTSTTTLAKHLFIFPFALANGVLFFFWQDTREMAREMPFEKKISHKARLGHTGRGDPREWKRTVEESRAWEDNTLFVGFLLFLLLLSVTSYFPLRVLEDERLFFFLSVDIPIHTQQLEFNFFSLSLLKVFVSSRLVSFDCDCCLKGWKLFGRVHQRADVAFEVVHEEVS